MVRGFVWEKVAGWQAHEGEVRTQCIPLTYLGPKIQGHGNIKVATDTFDSTTQDCWKTHARSASLSTNTDARERSPASSTSTRGGFVHPSEPFTQAPLINSSDTNLSLSSTCDITTSSRGTLRTSHSNPKSTMITSSLRQSSLATASSTAFWLM